jgi:SHS2 domain-containing protein
MALSTPVRQGVGMAHRFVEHVAEVELELEATSERGIFEDALAAFAELVATDRPLVPASHEIELVERDRALLLHDWLDELVYLADVGGFVPERVASFELDEGRLRATVEGGRGEVRPLVKAVTLSGLALGRRAGRWRGHVVLDV